MLVRRPSGRTTDRKIADAHVSGIKGAMSGFGFHRTGSGVRAASGLPAHGSQRENEQDPPSFGNGAEKPVGHARRKTGKQQSAECRTRIVRAGLQGRMGLAAHAPSRDHWLGKVSFSRDPRRIQPMSRFLGQRRQGRDPNQERSQSRAMGDPAARRLRASAHEPCALRDLPRGRLRTPRSRSRNMSARPSGHGILPAGSPFNRPQSCPVARTGRQYSGTTATPSRLDRSQASAIARAVRPSSSVTDGGRPSRTADWNSSSAWKNDAS